MKKAPWRTLPMQIGLYDIKNLKVTDTKGKAIEKFAFDTQDFNPYDPHGICKNKCVRIHFQWLSRTFHWQEEDPSKNFYNASKTYELVNFARTSQVAPQKATTQEAVLAEGSNPVHDKGKRKVMHIPGGERSHKMKVNPIVMKVDLAIEAARKQRM